MKLRYALLITLFSTIVISCSEDDEPSRSLQGGDFLPVTEGNRWEYGGDFPYSMEFNGNTKEINGKTYAEADVEREGQKNNAYLLVEDGVYSSVGFLADNELNIILLKENVSIGATWETATVINGLNTIYQFSLAEKGIERMVSGENFTDVIRVRVDTNIQIFGVRQVLASQDVYFARGVGIIETDLGQLGHAPLIDYTIN